MFHEDEAGQAADRSPQQIQTEITDPNVLFAVDGAGRRGPAVIGFFKQGEKVDLASIEPGTAALPFAQSAVSARTRRRFCEAGRSNGFRLGSAPRPSYGRLNRH